MIPDRILHTVAEIFKHQIKNESYNSYNQCDRANLNKVKPSLERKPDRFYAFHRPLTI